VWVLGLAKIMTDGDSPDSAPVVVRIFCTASLYEIRDGICSVMYGECPTNVPGKEIRQMLTHDWLAGG